MMDIPQTYFGLTLSADGHPVSREIARALAERITAAAQSVAAGTPAAWAASARRDAEQYLGARRRRDLRLPAAQERVCDEGAHAVMRATVGVPPLLHSGARLVA